MTPERIKVTIFGSEYSLVSDSDEMYLKDIAQLVDRKMREIDRTSNLTSTAKLAILTALNIADELYQECEYNKKLLLQINEESRKMNQNIEEFLEE